MRKLMLCLFIAYICGGFVFGCSPNERVYYKENIVCSASNRRSEDWRFFSIELGTPDMPYQGKPSVDINIPDLIEFTSSSITTNEILSIENSEVLDMIAIENAPNVGSWPESVKHILCGSFLSFVVDNEKVLQIKIANKGNFRLNGTKKWYELPCSEDEIIEVFGKPDKTYEWFRE